MICFLENYQECEDDYWGGQGRGEGGGKGGGRGEEGEEEGGRPPPWRTGRHLEQQH